MSQELIIPSTESIIKFLNKLRFSLYYSKPVMKHITSFFRAGVSRGFSCKINDISLKSQNHRTTIGHFLSNGVWDDGFMRKLIREQSLLHTLKQSASSSEPVFVIHDATVCSKSKPSSRAVSPMQGTDFHYSHLQGMVQCSDHSLIYDIKPYKKKGKSKIDSVCEIATSVPVPPNKGYALFDTWFAASKIINTYASKGYHCIGGLKTNRIIFPGGIYTNIKDFAVHIDTTDVSLVTAKGKQYYVYRYEGPIKDVENVVVLISWPMSAFKEPRALRAFVCTDTSLDSQTILEYYGKCWPVEVFFQEQKSNFGFDKYQIRNFKGIKRLWVLLAMLHLFCTIGLGKPLKLSIGLQQVRKEERQSSIRWIYECGQKGVPLDREFESLSVA